MPVTINSIRLLEELHHLATFTDSPQSPPTTTSGIPDTPVTRIVFTDKDREARAWLSQLATEAGLTIRHDAIGNTFFRWQGSTPGEPAVATGSHIDAIPNAGMYDGTVGVLGGLEAIRALKASGFAPERSIELILFTSEEPTRFGIGCLGSRLMSGTLCAEAAEKLRDPEGKSLDEARTAAGFTGSLNQVQIDQDHYAAFIELHIEQGPILEREGESIGIVRAIAAPASASITINGLGGHAGALLMPDRRDALTAAAEVILAIESAARATGVADTVATVGTCDVFPGAVNSVASRVRLSLDVRDIDEARRNSVLASIRHACNYIATERNVTITNQPLNSDSPCICAPSVVGNIEEVCVQTRTATRAMISRAYHDTLFMARICPAGMIFIPCRGGVSHRPDEYATPEAIAKGTEILAATLAALSVS